MSLSSIFTRFHPFAGRVRPRLPRLAGWRCVVRYMAVSLFDADVRNRWMNVLMRVRIIFITPPQHLQRIAGRGCGGGSTTRLSSCTSGISLLPIVVIFIFGCPFLWLVVSKATTTLAL